VHYILQAIADVLSGAELFCRFISDIVWITASETSNKHICKALTEQHFLTVVWNDISPSLHSWINRSSKNPWC